MAGGQLVLAVGPSGAGKDTVLAGASDALTDDDGVVFPKRVITRPKDAGGEDHLAVTPEAFHVLRDGNELALHWQAHGLDYGIPVSITRHLAAGRVVVVNVSRTVIAAARERFPHVHVVHVTAPPRVLAKRLAARGRESESDILARLERRVADVSSGVGTWELANTGTPEQAVAAFLRILARIDQNAVPRACAVVRPACG